MDVARASLAGRAGLLGLPSGTATVLRQSGQSADQPLQPIPISPVELASVVCTPFMSTE
jgi:hypothetical protein